MIIRNATTKDWKTLKKIKPGLTDAAIEHRLKEQSDGLADFIVLEDGGLKSCVVLTYYGKPTHPEYPDIVDLFTTEASRHQGYGRTLVNECLKRARDRGAKKIGLSIYKDADPRVQKWYEKLGFRRLKELPYYYIVKGTKNWARDFTLDIKPSNS